MGAVFGIVAMRCNAMRNVTLADRLSQRYMEYREMVARKAVHAE